MTAMPDYEAFQAEREALVRQVVDSTAGLRLVVAGPGTGKTYLFQVVVQDGRKYLTLSFVNSLVDDLSLALFGRSEVKTLHGFARSELRRLIGESVRVSPLLPAIVREDVEILEGEAVDFEHLFHTRQEDDPAMAIYEERRKLYGHFGFADIVSHVVRRYEEDPTAVPAYDCVLVDEFQDFNPLEVALIEMLGTRSPLLLVGDDDQALYEYLKSASPRYIRDRHIGEAGDYAVFELPYCSRCTDVIVDAANNLVATAQSHGLLSNRIPKRLNYFPSEEKDAESQANPSITFAQIFANQVPGFITSSVEKIGSRLRRPFEILVLSPTRLQCITLAAKLASKGFSSISLAVRGGMDSQRLLDGLRLLLDDKDCNLGWRIAASEVLDRERLAEVVGETARSNGDDVRISGMLKAQERSLIKRLLASARKVRSRQPTSDDNLRELLEACGIDALEAASQSLRDGHLAELPHGLPTGLAKTPVTITTFQGAKGLAADYVFIVNFDDQYCIKDRAAGPSDQDVCGFLVALTRARAGAYLVSTRAPDGDPTFLEWIGLSRVERV